MHIRTDSDWNNNINLWVTDGLQFTSRSALISYLEGFGLIDRYKISNRGIIITHYENGGISITPVFTSDTIKTDFANAYQPILPSAATGNLSVYDNSGVLFDSGKSLSSFATATQGAKADSAVTYTSQTFVDSLKAQGVFNKEAQAEALKTALDRAMMLLASDTKELLASLYGSLNDWLTTKIEQAVKERKG